MGSWPIFAQAGFFSKLLGRWTALCLVLTLLWLVVGLRLLPRRAVDGP
jgi:hypothetical protein